MNVKAGSVLEHKSKFSHPGLLVLTLEDSPGKHKMTRVMVLCSDMFDITFWFGGRIMFWKLIPEDWKKIA